MKGLEVPGSSSDPDWDALYLYRGQEVNLNRPIITGDVFAKPQSDELVQVLQHPCAIRSNGINLVDPLLICAVNVSSPVGAKSWSGNYKQMPLPNLTEDPNLHHSAWFNQLELANNADLEQFVRVACLSHLGVNLLLQRWIHHNSRVVIPSWKINEATVEQLEETELVEEWCDEEVDRGLNIDQAGSSAHEWLRSKTDSGKSWQELLQEPQTRSKVRNGMRQELKRRAMLT